ncbi:hypothetical protein J2X69_001355 [Algoriphagus sp. 4150]|uniref:hypothetical protein n=1 Tax=Algoriphagus sp. 4150 TaxID=2817756 RepID=UPI0028590353|nr:hypothetical protein [Algoriphagus sp. 4150]MDR7129020.1 hypothetical protein [Algoriphagus sp. 4150]
MKLTLIISLYILFAFGCSQKEKKGSPEKEIQRAKGAMLTADFKRAQSILANIPAGSKYKNEIDSLYIVAGKAQIFLDSAQEKKKYLAKKKTKLNKLNGL